jgi:hypothetical protein
VPLAFYRYNHCAYTLVMLIEAVRWLREAGLTVEDRAADTAAATVVDALLDVASDGLSARFAARAKGRAPYPHEVKGLERSRNELAEWGYPLIAAPFVSEPLGAILTGAGWSWADDQGNFDLRAPGLLLRQRLAARRPATRRRSLPRGSGSFAIIRALVGFVDGEGEGPSATALAVQAGISQPRVSQILHQLLDLNLVERSPDAYWKPRREALLDRFLEEYPGPGGSAQYCFGLEAPGDTAARAGRMAGLPHQIVVSADVGPDLIVHWRRPSLVILYTKHAIDPADLELVSAQGPQDANVIIRMPGDRSVFPAGSLTAQLQDNDVPLADPLQQIWDLHDLGGTDRLEAAGRLRQWLLAHR